MPASPALDSAHPFPAPEAGANPISALGSAQPYIRQERPGRGAPTQSGGAPRARRGAWRPRRDAALIGLGLHFASVLTACQPAGGPGAPGASGAAGAGSRAVTGSPGTQAPVTGTPGTSASSAQSRGEPVSAASALAPLNNPPRAEPALASTTPSGQGPRFSARRQLRLAAKPRGLLATAGAAGQAADLWLLLEDPGELLRFVGGQLSAPAERWSVGAWGVGPVAVSAAGPGPTRVALASMAERSLHWLTAGEASGRSESLPGVPVDLASAPDGALWVLGRAGELWRFIGETPSGAWQTPLERATALAIDTQGRLWIAAQVPAAVFCLETERFLDDSAASQATPTKVFPLPAVPRDLHLFAGCEEGSPEILGAVGEQSLYRFDLEQGSSQALLAPGKVPMALTSADLDGDGRPELLDINRYDTSYGVLSRFDPQAARFTLYLTEYAGQSPAALACADFDGDGRPDLAIANRDAQALSLLPGSGRVKPEQPAFYQAQRLAVGNNPLFALCADLNGDGAAEGFSLDSSSGTLTWFQNRFGRLVEPRSLPLGPSPSAAVALDWNSDGQLDLAVLLEPTSGSRLLVLLGDGQGGLRTSPIDWPVGRASGLWAHVSADGQRGLVLADSGEARLGLWLPGATELRWTPLPGTPRAVTSAVTSTGASAELWVATDGPNPLLLRLKGPLADGSLELSGQSPLPHPAIELGLLESPQGPRLCLLAALSSDQKAAQLFLADLPKEATGIGALQWQPGPIVGQKPIQMATGDLDGDGYGDLAIAAQNEHSIELYAQKPQTAAAGLVWQRWPDLGAGLGCFSVCLSDLDQNGQLDVLVANAFSHDLSAIYALPNR